MGEQGNLFVAVAVLKSSNSTDRFRKTMFAVSETTENTTAAVIAAVILNHHISQEHCCCNS